MAETEETTSPNFINAFQLIAMSNDLDLSGLFEGEVCKKFVISLLCYVVTTRNSLNTSQLLHI